MTEVRFDWEYDRKGRLSSWLAVRGHAADSESRDYINGIVFALAAYLENAKRNGRIGAEMSINEKRKPRATLRAWDLDEGADACFQMAALGLLALERRRPDAVTVELDYVDKPLAERDAT